MGRRGDRSFRMSCSDEWGLVIRYVQRELVLERIEQTDSGGCDEVVCAECD